MPAQSQRQQRFMALCSKNPSKARGNCPSKKVAMEFSHKPEGGYSKAKMPKRDRRRVKWY